MDKMRPGRVPSESPPLMRSLQSHAPTSVEAFNLADQQKTSAQSSESPRFGSNAKTPRRQGGIPISPFGVPYDNLNQERGGYALSTPVASGSGPRRISGKGHDVTSNNSRLKSREFHGVEVPSRHARLDEDVVTDVVGRLSGQKGKKLLTSTDEPRKLPKRHSRNTSLEDQPQHRNASGLLSLYDTSHGRPNDDSPSVIELSDSDRESSQDPQASTSRLPIRPRSLIVSPTQRRSSKTSFSANGRDDTAATVGVKRKKSADSIGEQTPLKITRDNAKPGAGGRLSVPPDESLDEIDFLRSDHSESLSPARPEGRQPIASRMAPRNGNKHLGSKTFATGSLANSSQRATSVSSALQTGRESNLSRDEQIELQWVSFGDVDAYLAVESPVIKYSRLSHDFRLLYSTSQRPSEVNIAISDLNSIVLSDLKRTGKLVICFSVTSKSQTAVKVHKAAPDWDSRSSCPEIIGLVREEARAAYRDFTEWLQTVCHHGLSFADEAAAETILQRALKAVERKTRKLNIHTEERMPSHHTTPPDAKVISHPDAAGKQESVRRDTKQEGRRGLSSDMEQNTSNSSTNFSSTTLNATSRPKARPASSKSTYAADRLRRSTSGSKPMCLPLKSGEASQTLVERRRPQRTNDNLKLRYPFDGPGSVSVFESDYDRLEEGEFLNDTLVEFGLKHYLSQIQDRDPTLYDSMYVFNTFLYRQLTKVRGKQDVGYQQVRKWTSKANIFDKKFLVVPINENLHWYLAIVVNPGKALDSVVKEENVDPSSDEAVSVKSRLARNSCLRSTPEDASRSRRSGTARSLSYSTPERPSEGADVREFQKDEPTLADERSDKSVIIAPEETGVEVSYSQMSILTKDGHQESEKISGPSRVHKPQPSRYESAAMAHRLLEMDCNEVDDDNNLPKSPSLSPSPPSEPEPIILSARRTEGFRTSQSPCNDRNRFIPPSLNGAIFGQGFLKDIDLSLGVGDGKDIRQKSEMSAAPKSVLASSVKQFSPGLRRTSDAQDESIAISDDDDEGQPDNDVSMQDISRAASNIHNTGRGRQIGGGPFLPSGSSRLKGGSSSSSPPLLNSDSHKKPVPIVAGESYQKWNTNQSPSSHPTSRPQAKPASSKEGTRTSEPYKSAFRAGSGVASTASFYANKSPFAATANGARSSQISIKPDVAGDSKRALSDKTDVARQEVAAVDNSSESGVPELSQEPVLPGRQKFTSDRATAVNVNVSDNIESTKSRTQRGPSAAAIAKRREQLEGLVVLTFDSLGGKHPAVSTTVKNYLRNEALDKKGIRIDPQPASIDVNVPGQSNWCDCGLFVLLYFDRFFSNPELFLQYIIPERDDEAKAWEAESAIQARNKLRKLIDGLSTEYAEKKRRAEEDAKAAADAGGIEGKAKEEEDSQSDVELVPLDALEVEREREREREKEHRERDDDKHGDELGGWRQTGVGLTSVEMAETRQGDSSGDGSGDVAVDASSIEANPSTSPV